MAKILELRKRAYVWGEYGRGGYDYISYYIAYSDSIERIAFDVELKDESTTYNYCEICESRIAQGQALCCCCEKGL